MGQAALPVNAGRGKGLPMRKSSRHSKPKGQAVRLWGRHPVTAALANPDRNIRKLWGTRDALASLDLPSVLPISHCEVTDLARMVPKDVPHQGLVLELDPLDDLWLGDVLDRAEQSGGDKTRPIVVLDQVTDPHNVGAILRSAAAFDAVAVVTQDRHSPPESGTIARAASGALETMPWVRVVNLARALEEIAEASYWRIGLDGAGKTLLNEAVAGANRVALVLGAEGEGLRHNSVQHCDIVARLPISSTVESLNVSNAAAIALYAVATSRS